MCIIEHLLYDIYFMSGVIIENEIEIELTGNFLQLYLVCRKIFIKWYHCYYFSLREMHPSSEILEQARVSQRKGVEIQASSKKTFWACQSRQRMVCSCEASLVIWMYSLERVTYLRSRTHAQTQSIHYRVAIRHWEQCICLAWQVNGCLLSVGHSFSW